MKKFILPLAIAALFSACNTEKKDDAKREMVILNDSLYRNNVMSDTGTSIVAEPAISEPVAVKKAAPRKTIVKSPRKTTSAPVVSNTPQTTAPLPTNTGTSTQPSTGTTADAGTGTTGTDNTTTAPEKKEGWSKAAKGAAIGGVAGAVAGAVLTKKGTGAVIGGVVGAAGGYILGRKKDKADGRVQ